MVITAASGHNYPVQHIYGLIRRLSFIDSTSSFIPPVDNIPSGMVSSFWQLKGKEPERFI